MKKANEKRSIIKGIIIGILVYCGCAYAFIYNGMYPVTEIKSVSISCTVTNFKLNTYNDLGWPIYGFDYVLDNGEPGSSYKADVQIICYDKNNKKIDTGYWNINNYDNGIPYKGAVAIESMEPIARIDCNGYQTVVKKGNPVAFIVCFIISLLIGYLFVDRKKKEGQSVESTQSSELDRDIEDEKHQEELKHQANDIGTIVIKSMVITFVIFIILIFAAVIYFYYKF